VVACAVTPDVTKVSVPAQNDAVALAVVAARAADDKKATDLVLLDVADILAVVDLFLLVTTANDRQLKAVVDEIDRRAREDEGRRPLRREGTPESGWLLLDYGDVVCHLFTTDQRDFYALDRLWADVPHLDPLTGDLVSEGRVGPADIERDVETAGDRA
jgi:ribosome-associated protein